MNVDEAVATLEAHPDFKILRRFKAPKKGMYNGPTGLTRICRGVYLDTETTGTDVAHCEILELAIVPFLYEAGGKLLGIREDQCMAFLNEPSKPLDENIRKLTGINDEDLVGKRLDLDIINLMFVDVDLVVAHNAAYDRKVMERYVPITKTVAWACSQQDVPWREVFRAPAERLEILAHFMSGVFYGAHRAMIDCMIGVHVLATTEDDEGKTAFEYLLENSQRESVRVWATGAPFETKDMLRDRGYRWNDGRDGRFKAWHKVIRPEDLDAENQWLRNSCGAHPQATTVEALDRYSIRER